MGEAQAHTHFRLGVGFTFTRLDLCEKQTGLAVQHQCPGEQGVRLIGLFFIPISRARLLLRGIEAAFFNVDASKLKMGASIVRVGGQVFPQRGCALMTLFSALPDRVRRLLHMSWPHHDKGHDRQCGDQQNCRGSSPP